MLATLGTGPLMMLSDNGDSDRRCNQPKEKRREAAATYAHIILGADVERMRLVSKAWQLRFGRTLGLGLLVGRHGGQTNKLTN